MDDRTFLERVRAAFAGMPKPADEALVNRHCCECLEKAVDVIADNLVFQLTPPGESGLPAHAGAVVDWFEPRARGFPPDQRAAIVAFLLWFAEREAADWSRIGAAPPGSADRALA